MLTSNAASVASAAVLPFAVPAIPPVVVAMLTSRTPSTRIPVVHTQRPNRLTVLGDFDGTRVAAWAAHRAGRGAWRRTAVDLSEDGGCVALPVDTFAVYVEVTGGGPSVRLRVTVEHDEAAEESVTARLADKAVAPAELEFFRRLLNGERPFAQKWATSQPSSPCTPAILDG